MTLSKIVLDTNIVSYLMKADPIGELYKKHVEDKLLSITFITVGELYFGAENKKWGSDKRNKLETTLRNFVVIPYDNEIARCYGRIALSSPKTPSQQYFSKTTAQI